MLRRWRRDHELEHPGDGAELDPQLARRLDRELARYDG
jgi:hypothetical protein